MKLDQTLYDYDHQFSDHSFGSIHVDPSIFNMSKRLSDATPGPAAAGDHSAVPGLQRGHLGSGAASNGGANKNWENF